MFPHLRMKHIAGLHGPPDGQGPRKLCLLWAALASKKSGTLTVYYGRHGSSLKVMPNIFNALWRLVTV